MRRWLLASVVAVAIIVAVVAWPESSTSPSMPPGPYVIENTKLELADGSYSDTNGFVSVAEFTSGDINGDDLDDWLVVLVQNSRGSGVFYYVNVLLAMDGGGFTNAGSVFLGDRLRIGDAVIDTRMATAKVDYYERSDDQPMAAEPTRAATRVWQIVDGEMSDVDPVLARGAVVIDRYRRELKAALINGMADGQAAGISTCRMAAPALAEAASVDGVRVGRTSHRLRNPANAGPDWATRVLEQYLADDADPIPMLVALDDGRQGYVEPIPVGPLCITCHGDTLSPELADAIAKRYPEDKATGFAIGDLRGVFWAELPAR